MKKVFILFFFTTLFLVEFCSATKIHGVIYDSSLNPVKDSVVEVNSVPMQRFISKDGSYSFNLNPGDYVITAKYEGMLAKESFSIKDESGDYVIDLFLFPTFEDEEELLNETNLDISGDYFNETYYSKFVIIAAIVLVVLFVFLVWKSRKKLKSEVSHEVREEKVVVKEEKHELDDLDNVVDFIRKEGGRVTQKDIRKKFPLSEAKISLIISELEHKSIVEKIKKGRGNIIVLKRLG